MSALAQLNTITAQLKTSYIARDEVIDYLKYSLVAQSHVLVIGPPGAAKSAIFGDFFAHLEGRKGFFALTKGSTPETLVGPMSLRAIKEEDTFRYNVIVDCRERRFYNRRRVSAVWRRQRHQGDSR